MVEKEKLLTRPEVAAVLGVPPATLSRWAYEGKGPSYFRVGKHARYRWEDVERFLHENRKAQGTRKVGV